MKYLSNGRDESDRESRLKAKWKEIKSTYGIFDVK